MIKLEIEKIEGYIYTLKDETGKVYSLNLDFFEIEENIKIGDFIFFNEELLNKKYDGYSTSYTFGNLENKYGKSNILIDDIDVIRLITDDKEIYLKRLYG